MMSKMFSSALRGVNSGRYQPRGEGGRRTRRRASSALPRSRMRPMVRRQGSGARPSPARPSGCGDSTFVPPKHAGYGSFGGKQMPVPSTPHDPGVAGVHVAPSDERWPHRRGSAEPRGAKKLPGGPSTPWPSAGQTTGS
jgi:hypothetical protein